MVRNFFIACVVVAAVAFSTKPAEGQWVVHVLGGTVESVQPAKKAMFVITDDGSPGDFQFPQSASVNVSFDKDVRAETTPPEKLNAQGHHVLMFYFGADRVRTVFAAVDLGSGPFVKVTGTVESYDKHERTLTMLAKDGSSQKFIIGDKTVIDTPDGVATGKKLHLDKGDRVRLLGQTDKGGMQALLVRTGAIDATI